MLGKKRDIMQRSAVLSDCGAYRYELRRTWDRRRPIVLWVGLNPSTADHIKDDPTNRRIADFSQRWGYGGYVLVNLFAYRSINPKALALVADPIGPNNDAYLAQLSKAAHHTICAWGNHGKRLNRASAVLPLLVEPMALGITKQGQPLHPLYCPANTQPQPFCELGARGKPLLKGPPKLQL